VWIVIAKKRVHNLQQVLRMKEDTQRVKLMEIQTHVQKFRQIKLVNAHATGMLRQHIGHQMVFVETYLEAQTHSVNVVEIVKKYVLVWTILLHQKVFKTFLYLSLVRLYLNRDVLFVLEIAITVAAE
jgi:hypothetical protein